MNASPPLIPPIARPDHPLIKHARRLRQRKHRRAAGAFLVEGPRGFLAAAASGAAIEAVITCPEQLTSPAVREAIERLAVAVHPVTAAVFDILSERDNPTGIAAVVRIAEPALGDLAVPPDGLFVALAGASDPGNVGTILRTMDAVGAGGLILIGPETTDPYHPTAVKASMGALFTVPVVHAPFDDVWAWSRRHAITTIATSARAPLPHWAPEALGHPPRLLVMGSERAGLAADVVNRCDRQVGIPMTGTVSSLNLAVATALLLYEARRANI